MSTSAAVGAGEPFDPDGVVWTRVSGRLAAVRRVMICGPLGLLALLLVIAGLVPGLGLLAPWAVLPSGLGLWVWWMIGRQVPAWGYAERDDDLLVRHGLLWREIVVVPYGRMQYVDVQAGPVDRAFGIARVQLHTASAATDAWIPGLTPVEAARLRDRLASRGQARLAGL
jgi:membrane protein YdbS with pleckstrin-like domain